MLDQGRTHVPGRGETRGEHALERRARWQSTQPAPIDDGPSLDSPTRVGDADSVRAAEAASALARAAACSSPWSFCLCSRRR